MIYFFHIPLCNSYTNELAEMLQSNENILRVSVSLLFGEKTFLFLHWIKSLKTYSSHSRKNLSKNSSRNECLVLAIFRPVSVFISLSNFNNLS